MHCDTRLTSGLAFLAGFGWSKPGSSISAGEYWCAPPGPAAASSPPAPSGSGLTCVGVTERALPCPLAASTSAAGFARRLFVPPVIELAAAAAWRPTAEPLSWRPTAEPLSWHCRTRCGPPCTPFLFLMAFIPTLFSQKSNFHMWVLA